MMHGWQGARNGSITWFICRSRPPASLRYTTSRPSIAPFSAFFLSEIAPSWPTCLYCASLDRESITALGALVERTTYIPFSLLAYLLSLPTTKRSRKGVLCPTENLFRHSSVIYISLLPSLCRSPYQRWTGVAPAFEQE
ncbi:hypothetical protein BDV12DRAFT_103584 [Aspergillus spectabilis]